MIVKARNIHKFYGDLHVLKGVDFEVEESEIVSIVGPSGAGKSTLLHILGTLDKASNNSNKSLELDRASVLYQGKDVLGLNDRKLSTFRNENIGFIFQFHGLLPEFTALENIILPALIGNKSKNESKSRALELLKILGVEKRVNHKPSELSGGEQQRVSVARALMNKPKIIFADEPSGNLDSANAKNLHEIFLKLRDDFGQTFVIVTHDDELADISDRKLFMKDGLFEKS